jgi:prepilin-type N-terminal cleavage/methylation domain-containing protein
MNMLRNQRRSSGFTLIEILIVVIILGILAAIVIPQFASASSDARKASVASTVQSIRDEVQLYRVQHGDLVPDLVTNWDPLTTITSYGSNPKLGPYLQSTPINPMITSTVAGANSKVTDGNCDNAAGPFTGAFVYDYNGGMGSGKCWALDDNGKVVAP